MVLESQIPLSTAGCLWLTPQHLLIYRKICGIRAKFSHILKKSVRIWLNLHTDLEWWIWVLILVLASCLSLYWENCLSIERIVSLLKELSPYWENCLPIEIILSLLRELSPYWEYSLPIESIVSLYWENCPPIEIIFSPYWEYCLSNARIVSLFRELFLYWDNYLSILR